jgi:hypothetical protein
MSCCCIPDIVVEFNSENQELNDEGMGVEQEKTCIAQTLRNLDALGRLLR